MADITADAIALQERDGFRAAGWLKVIAPAKVNLHLAIGARRTDGYHEAVSVMHAINLHDIVYARRTPSSNPTVHMVACGDVDVAPIAPEDNIAARAVRELGVDGIELRIEKNIPVEGGLGGGSTDAAAALVAAAALAGLAPDDPAIEQAARSLGADVAFFLHGGCAVLGGAGDEFLRALEPSRRAIALVKPASGVSTAAAYRTFDEMPSPIPADIVANAESAKRADEIMLFNNLAPASERLAPELAEVRTWLALQPGVEDTLLCGSGSTTFAVCSDFSAACAVVAGARHRGWWARASSFGSIGAMIVSDAGSVRSAASQAPDDASAIGNRNGGAAL